MFTGVSINKKKRIIMTSTNFSVGFGGSTKSSSKVLKPPGGGSSDIFGSTEAVNASRAQSRNNNASSNIFAAPADNGRNGETPRRARNADSHNRLFGEQERPNTTAKNHMKSSIALGGDETDRKSVTSNSSSAAAPPPTNGHGNGKMHNGNGIGSGDSASTGNKGDGNPVTGEGYKPAGAEINTTVPALNGANQVINKNRVPPGGYSSGLW